MGCGSSTQKQELAEATKEAYEIPAPDAACSGTTIPENRSSSVVTPQTVTFVTVQIDCPGLPQNNDDPPCCEFELASDDGDSCAGGSQGSESNTVGASCSSTCSVSFNPYAEIEAKTHADGNPQQPRQSSLSSTTSFIPDVSLSNLSTLTPRLPNDAAALRRTYEGKDLVVRTEDRSALLDTCLLNPQQRVDARTQELNAFFDRNDPSVVEGNGLLVPHVGFFNAYLPAPAFKKSVPRHRAWFLSTVAQIRSLVFSPGGRAAALALVDQIENQSTIQRVSYVNGLAKLLGIKIRDLALLDGNPRHFLKLLKESGDIEGYQDRFRHETSTDGRRASQLMPGEVLSDPATSFGSSGESAATNTCVTDHGRSGLAVFIQTQLHAEIQYTVLCLECFIVQTLNETSRAAVWSPPQRQTFL